MIVFYFFSPRVSRSVVYGPKPRNRLDIYLPRNHQGGEDGPGEPLPVVIFITGASLPARLPLLPSCSRP